jgi:hypothetical protein
MVISQLESENAKKKKDKMKMKLNKQFYSVNNFVRTETKQKISFFERLASYFEKRKLVTFSFG